MIARLLGPNKNILHVTIILFYFEWSLRERDSNGYGYFAFCRGELIKAIKPNIYAAAGATAIRS